MRSTYLELTLNKNDGTTTDDIRNSCFHIVLNADHVESKPDQVESNRDLVESNGDHIESNNDKKNAEFSNIMNDGFHSNTRHGNYSYYSIKSTSKRTSNNLSGTYEEIAKPTHIAVGLIIDNTR